MTWLLYIPLGLLGFALCGLACLFWPKPMLAGDPQLNLSFLALVAGAVFLVIAGRWSV